MIDKTECNAIVENIGYGVEYIIEAVKEEQVKNAKLLAERNRLKEQRDCLLSFVKQMRGDMNISTPWSLQQRETARSIMNSLIAKCEGDDE